MPNFIYLENIQVYIDHLILFFLFIFINLFSTVSNRLNSFNNALFVALVSSSSNKKHSTMSQKNFSSMGLDGIRIFSMSFSKS